MSRLDSFIRRLEAQRACLDRGAELIRDIDGFVLELGLGNGRTYDHLRSLFPDRKIFVCERQVAAHPDCVPPSDMLILGDMRDTLRAVIGRLGARIAFAHLDSGTGDPAANRPIQRSSAGISNRSRCPTASPPAATTSIAGFSQPPSSIITVTWSEVWSQPRLARWT